MAIGLYSALKMNQWLGSGDTQPMAGKPARMGGASGYIMRVFAKAISLLRFLLLQRLQDLRSMRLEAFAVEQAIAGDPDHTLLGWLVASQQLVHRFPAAIQWLSLQRTPL